MKRTKRQIIVLSTLIAALGVFLAAGSALAENIDMQANMTEVADQMARWSKQCGAKPLTPEAQAKLSELLIETSELLRQIAANQDPEMQMQYNRRLADMKSAWDPFDTFYGN